MASGGLASPKNLLKGPGTQPMIATCHSIALWSTWLVMTVETIMLSLYPSVHRWWVSTLPSQELRFTNLCVRMHILSSDFILEIYTLHQVPPCLICLFHHLLSTSSKLELTFCWIKWPQAMQLHILPWTPHWIPYCSFSIKPFSLVLDTISPFVIYSN